MDKITRKDALSKGLSKYFTGVACKNGHTAERYVQSGTCEECIRESRAIMISPKNGEILPPQRSEIQQTRINIEQQKLALKAQKLNLERQKLELRLERAPVQAQTLELRVQARAERAERRERKSLAHSRLVDVFLFIDPLDYQTVTTMVWAYAAQRAPSLKLEDVVTGRELKDSRFVLRCFPEDKAEILRVAGEMFVRRNSVSAGEIERKVTDIQHALAASTDAQTEWPDGDPR